MSSESEERAGGEETDSRFSGANGGFASRAQRHGSFPNSPVGPALFCSRKGMSPREVRMAASSWVRERVLRGIHAGDRLQQIA